MQRPPGVVHRQTTLRGVHPQPPPPDEDSLAYCCGSCERFISSAFGWLGWKAATFPLAFLGFSIFLSTLACLGYFNFHFEPNRHLLYTPYDSDLGAQELSIYNGGFGQMVNDDVYGRRTNIIVQHAQSTGADIFTTQYLNAMFDIRSTIRATSITYLNTTYTFQDMCIKGTTLGAAASVTVGVATNAKAAECFYESVTDFWQNNQTTFLADGDHNATLFSQSTTTDATGRTFRRDDVLSAKNYNTFTNAYSRGITAFQISFWLQHRPVFTGFSDDQIPRDPIAELFEQAVEDKLNSISWSTTTSPLPSVFSVQMDILTPRRLLSDINYGEKQDQALMVLCYFAVWIYVAISYFRRNYIRSRMGMSVSAILTVVLALASGVGACSGMGIDIHRHLLLLSMFLLTLGLGDAFLLMTCIQPFVSPLGQTTPFDLNALASSKETRFWWIRGGRHEGVEARGGGEISSEAAISVGTAAAGPFITITSLVISCALLLGAYTMIPSFRSLCLTGGISVLFLWFYHFFFFIPCMAIDARRQNAHKSDIICCPTIEQGLDEKMCTSGREPFDENDSSIMGTFFGFPLIRLLFHPVVSVICILIFLLLLCLSIYGCTIVSSNINVDSSLYLPRLGSSYKASVAVRELYFASDTDQRLVHVYAAKSGTDFFANMAALDSLNTQIGYNTYIQQSTVQFWWRDYLTFLATTAPYNVAVSTSGLVSNGHPANSVVFESSLAAFLNTDTGAKYWLDVIPKGASASTLLGGGVQAARATFRLVALGSANDLYTAMNSLRTDLATSSGLSLFVWNPIFYELESQHIILWEMTKHMLLAGGISFLLLLFLLANLWSTVLIIGGSTIVIVEVIGILSLVHEPFSADTVHGLLFVPMLSAWFFIHFLHGFLRCLGTRPYRAQKVLQRMGGGIVDYTVVMLLSVLFLAASRTASFYSGFTAFGLTAALGSFNVLCILPLILAVLGPESSWLSEIHLTSTDLELTSPWSTTAPTALGVTDYSNKKHDPANPFLERPQLHQPTTHAAVEMEALVEEQRQQHQQQQQQPQQPSNIPASYASRDSFGSSTHGGIGLTGGSTLQNRSTPQKPTLIGQTNRIGGGWV